MPKVESEYSSFGTVVEPPDKPEPAPAPPPRKLKRPDIVAKFGWSSDAAVDVAIARFNFPRASGIESGWRTGTAPWWFEDKVDSWWAALRDDARTLRLMK